MPKRTPVPPVAAPTAVAPSNADRTRRIDALVAEVRKQYGAGSIFRYSDMDIEAVQTFPSGLDNVDAMIGCGGWPRDKLVQLYGPESVGKSSFCKYLIAVSQRLGYIPHFIDAELSPDTEERMLAFGVNVNDLLWSEVYYLEDAFALMETTMKKMARSPLPYILFFDSVAAAQLKVDAERGMDDLAIRAGRARFLADNLGRLVQCLTPQIGLVFVNQQRELANARPMQKTTYAPGGRALRHWCHLTIEMRKMGQIGRAPDVTGVKARLRVEKSKIGVPFKTADIDIHFDGRIEEGEHGGIEHE